MVHLNRNQLSKGQLEQLFTQLSVILGKSSATSANLFLSELLGYEERVMVAKRLACLILILKGMSPYRTSIILKISPSTADTISNNLESKKYEGIIKLLSQNKKNYRSILDTIDSILHLNGILPHYTGVERYKRLK